MSKQFKLLTLALSFLLSFSLLTDIPASAAKKTNPYGATNVDPAPANSPILLLSKGSKSVIFSLQQLQALKSSVITINEPFVKKRQSFRVIALSELFKLVGIVGTDKVQTLALNDYLYTNIAEEFLSAGGYLAIARDGLDIPYDQGGPIRIIFPSKSKWQKFLDPWNWSLKEISVK